MTKVLCANQFLMKNAILLPFPLRLITLRSSCINLICSSAVKSSVSLRIQSEYGKIWITKTLNKDTFHAMILFKKNIEALFTFVQEYSDNQSRFFKGNRIVISEMFTGYFSWWCFFFFLLRFTFRTQTL